MSAYDLTDTIVAPATPVAPSAIGIVRLSGTQAWDVTASVLRGLPAVQEIAARHAYVCGIELDEAMEDTCVALFWHAPLSYTGEDSAELMVHGSPVLMRRTIDKCQRAGARLAEPGEFTYRAYLHGKLDLAQAAAVQELIGASSSRALSLAAAQLAGLPGRRILEWQRELERLLAGIEVIHDYAADDLDASLDQGTLLTPVKLGHHLADLRAYMDAALEQARRSEPLRRGISVAICGPPNVGKSTLFNALLGHERALTAPEPGTTRDYISETLESNGVRLTLVDTAGWREAADSVEAAGVERAAQWASAADHVLWVTAADDMRDVANAPDGLQTTRVLTRCDLLPDWPQPPNNGHGPFHCVSGLTGRGVPELWQTLTALQSALEAPALDTLGTLQAQCVAQARQSLHAAIAALCAGMPMDAAALDIYAALEALHGSIEQADRTRIVEQIFSGFCVGK